MTPTEIRQLRIDAGLTQARFALRLGVSLKTVQSWEGGWRKCPEPMQRLMRLAIIQCGEYLP